ncbi:hypothetical protein FHT76_006851 [Rhizobium sp. BK176]|nr:hypothetical protein [Rhizobium sp. BK661]MCS4095141.1 hypothetical protein [Rhizobium sp. BK176]
MQPCPETHVRLAPIWRCDRHKRAEYCAMVAFSVDWNTVYASSYISCHCETVAVRSQHPSAAG